MSTSRTVSPPLVELFQQDAVAVEQITNTNKKQPVDVYVVIKNQPFNIYLKSTNTSRVNFNTATVKAQLYYDCEPPKPVDYIQHEPLQYVVTPNTSGSEVSVEVKIGILSSQHQGSLFVVMLQVVDQPGSVVASNPIRIVSKIDHIRKEGVSIKKPTFNEIIMDRLAYLEAQQEDQIKFLQHMIEKQGTNTTSLTPSPSRPGTPASTPPLLSTPSSTTSPLMETTSPPSSPGSSNESTPSTTTSTPQTTTPANTPTLPSLAISNRLPPMSLEALSRSDVEVLLSRMLAAYSNIDPDDRPEEIRKLVRSLGASLEADMKNLEKAFGTPIVAVKEEPGTEPLDATPSASFSRGHQRTASKGGTPIVPLPPPSSTTSTTSTSTHPHASAHHPSTPSTLKSLTHTPSKAHPISASRSANALLTTSGTPKFSISPAAQRRNVSESESASSETLDPMEIGNYLSRSFPPSPALTALAPAIQQQLSHLTAPLIPPQSNPQLISPPHSMELHQQSPQSSQELYSHQHEWPHYPQPSMYPHALSHQSLHPETAYLLIHPQFRNQSTPPPQLSTNTPYPPLYLPSQPTPPISLPPYHENKSGRKVDSSGTHIQEKVPISQYPPIKLEHLPTHTPPTQSPPYSTPPYFAATPPPASTPPQSSLNSSGHTFLPPTSYSNESFLVQQLVLELSQKNLTDQQIQQQVGLYIQHLQQQAQLQQQQMQLQQQTQLAQQQIQQQIQQQHIMQPHSQQSQQSQQFEFVLPRTEPTGMTSEWQF